MQRGTQILLLAITLAPMATMAQEGARPSPARLTLGELERMALEHHPAPRQAAAEIRAARGRRIQAGLPPNPSIGYEGDEIARGPIIRGGEHGGFLEIPVVLGKLRTDRAVAAQEERQAIIAAEAERYRLLAEVQSAYYATLVAERRVALQQRLAELARDAVAVSVQLENVGQADRPDRLAAEVEAERAEVALSMARIRRDAAWQELAAAVGIPSLDRTELEDTLDQGLPRFDFTRLLGELEQASPDLKRVRIEVERAELALRRARAERIPDLQLRGGLRYNRELLEVGNRPVGLEGFADVGIRLPVFNQNQGNIAAAQAELERARLEVERVRLALRTRLTRISERHLSGLAQIERLRDQMIPRAQRSYELYLKSYRTMTAAYPQVLVAQRTLFQLQVEYLDSLETFWQTVARLRGLLLTEPVTQ
jgi:cobalt-zinc-cadmium efflux system outer membrane protein